MDKSIYGNLNNRVKAILIDGLVLMGLGLAASTIFSKFESVADYSRIIVFVFIFILYDPLFTSINGATLGHMIMGLKVRRQTDVTKKIAFPIAILRFIVKAIFGIISLLTVTGSTKKQAIHDQAAKSVVLQS